MLNSTKNNEKIKKFIKKFGIYIGGGVIAIVIALSVIFSQTPQSTPSDLNIGEVPVEVSAPVLIFGSPLDGAVVIKDYSDKALQYNATLKHWEAHKGVDLISNSSNDVRCALDGRIASITSSFEDGTRIIIEHAEGLKTVYSSLSDSNGLIVGDEVRKGDKIGETSKNANNENYESNHVHFEVLKNDVKVDPNNYLNFGEK